jgi:hypothetical protein
MEELDQGFSHPSIKHPKTDISRPGFDLVHRRRAFYQRAIVTAYIVYYLEPVHDCPSACGLHTWINTGSTSSNVD